jgi:hypothetical protein
MIYSYLLFPLKVSSEMGSIFKDVCVHAEGLKIWMMVERTVIDNCGHTFDGNMYSKHLKIRQAGF